MSGKGVDLWAVDVLNEVGFEENWGIGLKVTTQTRDGRGGYGVVGRASRVAQLLVKNRSFPPGHQRMVETKADNRGHAIGECTRDQQGLERKESRRGGDRGRVRE